MSDRISRIFINSNYRTNVLDNHGNFAVDLPLGVLIEAGSHVRVEGFIVSHVWPTSLYTLPVPRGQPAL